MYNYPTLTIKPEYTKLEVCVYHGNESEFPELIEFCGSGRVSDIYTVDGGFVCRLTLNDGTEFTLIPGIALVKSLQTNDIIMLPAVALTQLYNIENGGSHGN